MSSECYVATYTSPSDRSNDELHGNRYSDLRWTPDEDDNDYITADDHYIEINNLDKGSQNLNVHSSYRLHDTSEQNSHAQPTEISNATTSTSETNERINQNPCHQSKRFIIAIVTMTILSVLVISITTALTMTFASVTVGQTVATALARENKTLSCVVTGWCSSIYWEKMQGGLAVQIDVAASPSRTSGSTLRNPSLTLYNVSAHDEGVYRCVATSFGLMKKSESIALKILDPNGSFMTTKYYTSEEFTDVTRFPTIAPPSFTLQTCQIKGGCTDPPKMQDGTACRFVSKDGRTSLIYSALKRKSVDTFEHCPVSVCEHGRWSFFNISASDKECFAINNNGQAIYRGKNTCTVSGRTCQRWNTDNPHKRNPDFIPKNPDDLNSNYCRDEGPPYTGQLWCYTTDSKVRWEYCYVPQC